MNLTATIVSIIAVVASLILVSRSAALRRTSMTGLIRLALIWGAIILALVAVIQATGLHVSA